MTYLTEEEQHALDQANYIRTVHYGLPYVENLAQGQRNSGARCPIAWTVNQSLPKEDEWVGINADTYSYTDRKTGVRKTRPTLSKKVGDFIRGFDNGGRFQRWLKKVGFGY